MKNYFGQALPLALLVLLLFVGLSFLPENMNIAGFPLQKMDIFSDIRAEEKNEADLADAPLTFADSTAMQDTLAAPLADTLAPAPSDNGPFNTYTKEQVNALKDSLAFGRGIEDYSPGQQALQRFFAAVDSIRQGRKVRVAWYGDSFVEGDILVGDLRDTLQTLWGGAGVGFVPITSEVAQFKRSFKHNFFDFFTYSIVKKTETRPPLGINGYAYQPSKQSRLHYEGADYFRHTRQFAQAQLFYTAKQDAAMNWQSSATENRSVALKADPSRLQVWQWASPGNALRSIDFRFPDAEGLMLYGAALESGAGIYLDNFSVRGNTGGALRLLKPDFVRQFDLYRQYDLIILQVGLNAVTHSLNNIRWYEAELDKTFGHLRRCFPNKPILVVSVGDRATKEEGELVTMRGVPAIVAMQRDLAGKHGLLFFDLFMGMGGKGSMVALAHHRPRYANLDYTHLTHEGGKYMSRLFLRLLLEAQQKAKKLN